MLAPCGKPYRTPGEEIRNRAYFRARDSRFTLQAGVQKSARFSVGPEIALLTHHALFLLRGSLACCTAGHPLFTTELLSHWLEMKDIEVDFKQVCRCGEHLHVVQGVPIYESHPASPHNTLAVLRARLGQLEEHLLQAGRPRRPHDLMTFLMTS